MWSHLTLIRPCLGPTLICFRKLSPLWQGPFSSDQEIPGEIPISCGFHCSNSQIEGETQVSLYTVFVSSRLTTVMEADFISLASVTVGMEHDSYTQALTSCLDENSVVSIFNSQSNRAIPKPILPPSKESCGGASLTATLFLQKTIVPWLIITCI